MEYWKKKNNIPGIEALADAGLTDGRAGSSAFQMATPGSSPNKINWLRALSGGMLGKGGWGGKLLKGDFKGAAGGFLNPMSAVTGSSSPPIVGMPGGALDVFRNRKAQEQAALAQGGIPEENPMAAVPVQTPMTMKSPMKQEDEGRKTIAGQNIIKDGDNFYYETGGDDQIYIEDPDEIVSKSVMEDGYVKDIDFLYEETEDGYYKVTGVSNEEEAPGKDGPEDMVPGGVGEAPMEMRSPNRIYSKKGDPEKY